jgi:hypothetical protein
VNRYERGLSSQEQRYTIEPLHLDPAEVADELRGDSVQQAAAEAAEEQS